MHYSFDIKSGENSKFCFTVRKAIDSYDLSFTGEAEECYQGLTMLDSSRVIGSQIIVDSNDVYYSEFCYNSNDIIGCYGLRKKSYCILNKQYSKEEYEKLKEEIIDNMKANGHWGNFFPEHMSPFDYNESIANEYLPLTKEEVMDKGLLWRDNIPYTTGQGTIEYENLPKNSDDYNDNLINEVLTCDNCEKNFKLINREINFYKKNKLLLPSRCFNCRHAERMGRRNKRNLWSAECAKCNSKILTSYNPEDQKIYKIYCESCFNKEVY